MTGIGLVNSYQPPSTSALNLPHPIVSSFLPPVHVDAEPELTILQELEAAINGFKQQLTEGVDPLVISKALTQIQPDHEESWTEEIWQIYDSFYEEVSQLEYQATFSPETGA
ncbi:MAG: hypothetical protein HC939_16400 [Pleurocapsa sp. SU_5_0]|nr:hypothetical protein [Pleurocapsa sp. SU_5_0]